MKKRPNDAMSNDGMADGTPSLSGFGGHPLMTQNRTATALESGTGDDVTATLATLGIEDAEQLVALAVVPEVRGELESVLSLSEGGIDTLLDQVKKLMPKERVDLIEKPAPADLALGVLPLTPTMLQEVEASVADELMTEAISIPVSINLIPYMPPVRNQASRGTCVAFALTALNEYVLRRRGLIRDLSEQHLYYETKLIDGAANACGTWQAKAVIALRTRGQCREQVWPYNPNPPCNNHGALPAGARPDALAYRLNTIAVPPRNVAQYKAHMALQRLVTLSIPVYNSWYQSAETRRSGRITMRVGNEPAVGGHAVCLVGYQDTPTSPGGGYFIVRNSWNGFWGIQSPYGIGYGTIPYQYIANEASEAFTAAIAGFGGDDTADTDVEEQVETGKSTVTIKVKPNITITIAAS